MALRTFRAVVCVGVLLISSSADSALLEFESLTLLEFSNFGHATVSAEGVGTAQVNGAGAAGHLDSLTLTTVNPAVLNAIIPVTDPVVAATIASVRVTSVRLRPDLQGNVFAPISGGLQGTVTKLTMNTLPFTGNVRICLFYAGCNSGHMDLRLGGTASGMLIAPGVGGTMAATSGSIRISLVAAPWTIGTVTVENRTSLGGITIFSRAGFAHGPASLTSSTAVTDGVVQLVTANQVTTIGVPGNQDISGQITLHRLHFIPEPGLLLLLGSGAAGMLLLGFARTRD